MNLLDNFTTKFKNDKKFRSIVIYFLFYPFTFGGKLISICYVMIIDYFCKDVLIIDDLEDNSFIDHVFIKFIESKMKLSNCIVTVTSAYHEEVFSANVDGNCHTLHGCKSATISINPKLFNEDKSSVYFVLFHEFVHLEQLHNKLIEFSFPFGFDYQSQDHFWQGQYVDISGVNALNYNMLPWEKHANQRGEVLLSEFLELQKQFQNDPELFM
jgi:hypothetical protein